MVDDGDDKRVDTTAWRASLEDDENIRRLAVDAIIVLEMREAVLKETQFTCSAGVAHNKVRLVSNQINFHLLTRAAFNFWFICSLDFHTLNNLAFFICIPPP